MLAITESQLRKTLLKHNTILNSNSYYNIGNVKSLGHTHSSWWSYLKLMVAIANTNINHYHLNMMT